MKKKTKITKLSHYEETLLWMSYRYAIGRHTIAAHGHGCDIVKYSYERLKLTPERCTFTGFDINQYIYDQMRFGFFSIDNYSINTKDVNPLDVFFEFINEENIISYEELGKYKRVVAKWDGSKWAFDRTLCDDNEKRSYVSRMDFEDLIVWQRAAKIFNLDGHKTVVTNYNGEIKEYECIEDYVLDTTKVNLFYKKEYVPVSNYVDNPALYTYISKDYITKVI